MNDESRIDLRNYPHSPQQRIAVSSSTEQASADALHIMFCGGFHSDMSGTKATALQAYCQEHGWAYTRFDYRGHGQSDGEAAEFSLQDWLADTLAVFDECNRPTILIGSSMGAWLATLVALRRRPFVSGLLLLAAAPDFLQELIEPELDPSALWDLQQGKAVELPARYDRPVPITQALLDSGRQLSLLDDSQADKLTCPLILLHGTGDDDVPYTLSIRLMEQHASDNAVLKLLNGADHRLSDSNSLTQMYNALQEIAAQASRS
ncbi:MAG: alpha/beta hydrolase [Granulosicoccus sp.]